MLFIKKLWRVLWLISPILGFAQKTTFPTDPKVVAKGQMIFENYCTACHNFSQKGIGPSLERATTELPVEYLKKMIRNAPEVIASGDARAAMLFDEYKQMMPPFTSLKPTEIEAILAFIHQNQKASPKDEYDAHALKNPIPAPITSLGGQLRLAYHSTAPATGTKAPLARINKMQTLKGQKERMFVVDLQGILYEIIDKEWRVAFDIRKHRPHFISMPGMGTGFGSFAFHPDFYENGLLYTTHAEKVRTAPADFGYADSIRVTLQWVLTEWKIENPKATVFEGTGRELWRINMVSGIHGVQEITFNPLAQKGSDDYGLLYIGVGDGGASEHGFPRLCSSSRYVWGSVLRIDPQGRNSRNGRYGIPTSNPFFNDSNPETVKEIYCRGFRNPNRITWTPDGKMLIDDIGHANIEELNIGIAGADYGWPYREGTFVINPEGKMSHVYALPADEPAHRYTYPVIQYDHDEGKAISGGFVYDGAAIAALKGKYLFGDINNGRIFLAKNTDLKIGHQAPTEELEIWVDGQLTTFQKLNGINKPDPRLGVGPQGEIYIFTKADGKMYRVVNYLPNPKN
ncbi:MAG: PQQ-dependent sugar dehydrogenase [Runella sp.]